MGFQRVRQDQKPARRKTDRPESKPQGNDIGYGSGTQVSCVGEVKKARDELGLAISVQAMEAERWGEDVPIQAFCKGKLAGSRG